MAKFGWAYVDCSNAGGSGSAGPARSVQFVTESGGATTGSYNFTFATSSMTLMLTGTLDVSGTISASHYHIKDVSTIDATGSTYFGDSIDDTHQRSGSLIVTAPTVRNGRDFILSASTSEERAWVRGFGGYHHKVVGAVYHIKTYDYILGCSASSDQTLYLPTASAVGAGSQLVIKDTYNNRPASSVYISASQHASPHQTVDDAGFYHLTGTMPAISLYSDGTNWFVY